MSYGVWKMVELRLRSESQKLRSDAKDARGAFQNQDNRDACEHLALALEEAAAALAARASTCRQAQRRDVQETKSKQQ